MENVEMNLKWEKSVIFQNLYNKHRAALPYPGMSGGVRGELLVREYLAHQGRIILRRSALRRV